MTGVEIIIEKFIPEFRKMLPRGLKTEGNILRSGG